MTEGYNRVYKMNGVNIIHIRNQYTTEFKQVIITFIYFDSIIGEIRIQHGENQVNYDAYSFLEQLASCHNAYQFKQKVLLKLDNIAQNHGIYIPRAEGKQYKQRQLEIALQNGGNVKDLQGSQQEEEHYNLSRIDEEYRTWGIKWMR